MSSPLTGCCAVEHDAHDAPGRCGNASEQRLILTRQELFDLVWSKPRQVLAVQHPGISPAVITRTCEEANVPLPARGYWAKVAEGKKVGRPQLPMRWPGQDDVVVLGKRDRYGGPPDRRSDEELAAAALPLPPVFIDDTDVLVEAAAAQLRPVKVARDLDCAHAEILKLLRREEQRRAKAAASSWAWDLPRYDGPCFSRQLRLIDAIFRGLSPLGQRPWVREDSKFQQGFGTCYTLSASIGIGSARLQVALPLDRHVQPKESAAYHQKVLRAVLTSELAWQDEPGSPLEKQLPEILRAMLRQAELQRRASAQWRYERELERIQDARRRLEAASARRQAERREALLRQAKAFEQAHRVRQFADACERAGRAPDGSPIGHWLVFARAVADDLESDEKPQPSSGP
jgi:hypothetical protein